MSYQRTAGHHCQGNRQRYLLIRLDWDAAFFGVIFGTLFAANVDVQKGNIGLETTLYLVFAGLEGMFLPLILITFTTEMIRVAFLLMAGMFIAIGTVGCTVFN